METQSCSSNCCLKLLKCQPNMSSFSLWKITHLVFLLDNTITTFARLQFSHVWPDFLLVDYYEEMKIFGHMNVVIFRPSNDEASDYLIKLVLLTNQVFFGRWWERKIFSPLEPFRFETIGNFCRFICSTQTFIFYTMMWWDLFDAPKFSNVKRSKPFLA